MHTPNKSIIPLAAGAAAFALIAALLIAEALHPVVMPAIYGALRNLTSPLGWQGFFDQLLCFRFML